MSDAQSDAEDEMDDGPPPPPLTTEQGDELLAAIAEMRKFGLMKRAVDATLGDEVLRIVDKLEDMLRTEYCQMVRYTQRQQTMIWLLEKQKETFRREMQFEEGFRKERARQQANLDAIAREAEGRLLYNLAAIVAPIAAPRAPRNFRLVIRCHMLAPR